MARHITLSHSLQCGVILVYICFPLVINSTVFHSQKCPSLDKKSIWSSCLNAPCYSETRLHNFPGSVQNKNGRPFVQKAEKSTIKGAENIKSFFLHVYILLILHCPTELHLQKTSSKIKLAGIPP